MASSIPLPLPVPSPDSQGFWDACKRHELVIQRCSKCRAYRYPPRPMCFDCNATNWEWAKASGRGTIYTYTITYQPVHPALDGRVPWTVITVELEEGVRMVSNLVDCPPEKVQIGMPVSVTFEDVNEEVTLPRFRPAQFPDG
ncbi:MAG: Zn-ribbon domain-containing OB-fold protein [Dehalococcoidia bacterium]